MLMTGVFLQALVELLIADGEAAMQWVLEKDMDFHKARHALARSLQARGSFVEAAEQLHHLFTSPKRPFCISMWEISDKVSLDISALHTHVLQMPPQTRQHENNQVITKSIPCKNIRIEL